MLHQCPLGSLTDHSGLESAAKISAGRWVSVLRSQRRDNHHSPVGTSRLSSSNQFCTRLIASLPLSLLFGPASFIIRNRWPSGECRGFDRCLCQRSSCLEQDLRAPGPEGGLGADPDHHQSNVSDSRRNERLKYPQGTPTLDPRLKPKPRRQSQFSGLYEARVWKWPTLRPCDGIQADMNFKLRRQKSPLCIRLRRFMLTRIDGSIRRLNIYGVPLRPPPLNDETHQRPDVIPWFPSGASTRATLSTR